MHLCLHLANTTFINEPLYASDHLLRRVKSLKLARAQRPCRQIPGDHVPVYLAQPGGEVISDTHDVMQVSAHDALRKATQPFSMRGKPQLLQRLGMTHIVPIAYHILIAKVKQYV